MRIVARVKPGSKFESVEKVSSNEFILRVKAPPVEGKANKAVIELLSEYFKRPKNKIIIVRGPAARNKTVDIL